MEIIDNRVERIVGRAFLEPTMETGGITRQENPQYQGERSNHTVPDGGVVQIDNPEQNRGQNNPSLENLRQRKYIVP